MSSAARSQELGRLRPPFAVNHCANVDCPHDPGLAALVLLDTKDVTIWRDVDGGFHICVGSPDDFRSVVLPQTVMQVLLRNLDELIGSGRG